MKEKSNLKQNHKNDLVLHIYQQEDAILRTYAWGICRQFNLDPSFADDLVQDCYYQIMQKEDRVALKYAKYGSRYLCRMLYNNLIDQWRKRQSNHQQEEVFGSSSSTTSGIYDMCVTLHKKQFYRSLRACLPEQDYRIMKRYIQGYSYKEMSAEFELAVSTIGVRIHRAKKAIAKAM